MCMKYVYERGRPPSNGLASNSFLIIDVDYLWEIFWFKTQCRHMVGKCKTYMEAAAIYSRLLSGSSPPEAWLYMSLDTPLHVQTKVDSDTGHFSLLLLQTVL